MLDILIRNGTILDGTGRARYRADIGIVGDRLAAIGDLQQAEPRVTVDATGKAVAPGFVDMHSHADFNLPGLPTADSLVRQGITTVVAGQCGFSMAPLLSETRDFGVDIQFSRDEAPWPVPLDADDQAIFSLKVPDIQNTWPMASWITDMDILSNRWGYVIGDFDTDGILNTALHIRGQRLFWDFVDNPKLVHYLFSVLAETYAAVVGYLKSRTGTCAIATNRSILNVDPRIYLHSNCSVQMISPEVYRAFLFPYEKYLAEHFQPYGTHHCGKNLDRFAEAYSIIPLGFLDVGWGSDIAACRRAFPTAFLNLRLSPVRMLQLSPENICQDVGQLLEAAGPLNRAGICCINMDPNTPDENIKALLEVVDHFRRSRQGL